MDAVPAAILTMSLAGGYLAQVLVNIVTIAYPNRPSWVAPVAAVVFGILACALVTFATLPASVTLDRQLVATIIGAGILSAGAASGAVATTNTADAKRKAEQAPPMPGKKY